MRRLMRWCRVGLALALLPVGAAGGAVDGEPQGASAPATLDAQGERPLEAVSPWAFKRIDRAYEDLAAERNDLALETLAEMRRNTKLNRRERALMWQAFAYVHSAREQYGEAASAFEECLAADGLDASATLQTRYNLAQIYVLLERPADAVREFRAWFAQAPNPSGAAYYLYAMAYVQQGDQEQALTLTRRAVEQGGADAKEPWLQLESALLIQLKKYDEAIPVLERLIERYSKKQYWMQLSAVFSELNRSEDALAVLALAHRQGLLTQSSELMALAQLYLYNQIPYKAAAVLEAGLRDGVISADARTYQLLADSLLHARERDRAMEPLRLAAERATDGNAYLRIAQVHLEREQWPEARAALGQALAKGNLSSPGHAWVLLGVANTNEKRWAEAEKAFVAAQEFEAVQEVAGHWLQHLSNQRASDAALAAQPAQDRHG